MLMRTFLRAPEGSGGGGSTSSGGEAGAGTNNAAGEAAARHAIEKADKEKPEINTSITNDDNAIQKARKKSKVESLADLKKLSSKHKAPEERIKTEVSVDSAAIRDEDGNSVTENEAQSGGKRAKKAKEATQSADAVSESVEVGDANAEVENAVTEEAEAYKPNLKYKAYDQEHDIPELFQGLIKDAESEKAVHEVFQKLHGFEKVKANHQALEKHVTEQIAPEMNFYRQFRETINEDLANGDFWAFTKRFNIPKEKVLQAVVEDINLKQMPPEERAVHEERHRVSAENRTLAKRLSSLEAQTQKSAQLAKRVSFESTFARGDVAAVEKSYDERIGKSGAFKRLVADYGDLVYRRTMDHPQGPIDLTPEQAIQEVMREYGLTVPTEEPGKSQVTKPVAPPKAAPQQPKQPAKIIPNVASRSSSTAKNRPEINNLDDLKKYRRQNYGR